MPRHTTPQMFADELTAGGAKNVEVVVTGVNVEVRARRGNHSYVAFFTALDGRFTHGYRTGVDASLTVVTIRTMKAFRDALGLPPVKPWQVGSANGGKMREFATPEAASAEIVRLRAEGQPAVVRHWRAGGFRTVPRVNDRMEH